MNTKHTNLFKKLLWTMCLAALVILCQASQAMAASLDEAGTYSELLNAIIAAHDGDVITITGQIDIPAGISLGGYPAHITLKRGNAAAKLNITSSPGAFPTTLYNFTFDGCEIPSANEFISINHAVSCDDSIFENCISTMASGAVYAWDGEAFFNNCVFENNTGINGGHIAMNNGAVINIDNCTLKNGHATGKGGAIFNAASTSTCHISSSIITGNAAGEYGGGVYNDGALTITGTKIYDNTASLGGADIASKGWMQNLESIETFIALFADEGIIPTAWVTDYTDGQPYSQYLRLDYIIPPTAVILDSASLGTAGDGKITGLESGKLYKVTVADVLSYVKADGTLTADEAEAAALLGTEITGLTNGETYLVEEYIPEPEEPTTVILDSSSLGIAGDGKISGLTSGKQYKVTMDGVTEYVKSDGTLTSNESEAEPLTGTEIVGLTNGKTYKVEEYTTVEPDPTDDPTPTPDPSDDPDPTPTPSPSPSHSSGSSHSSSSSLVTAPKAVVLTNGKAVLDTTKTEYLLGYTDGLIGNGGAVTKAQLVQILYRLLTPESKAVVFSDKNSFKDVAPTDWYNEAVSSLVNAGLISGSADGSFNPDKNVTWGEMCSILSKFAKPNSEWKIITRHWAKDAINTAISYRWFEYNDQFNPDGEVTRLEMLDFINTMFEWTTK